MTVFSHGYCDFDDCCFLCIHYNWQLQPGKRVWVETRNHPLQYGSQKQNTRLRAWHVKYNIPTDHMCLSARSAQAKKVKSRAARTDFQQPEQSVSLSAFLTLLIKSSQQARVQASIAIIVVDQHYFYIVIIIY